MKLTGLCTDLRQLENVTPISQSITLLEPLKKRPKRLTVGIKMGSLYVQ